MTSCAHSPEDDSGIYHACLEKLRQKDFRLTKQRETMVATIVAQHRPFSAESLHKEIKKRAKGKKFDLVTIYRSLATFEEIGLLNRCDFGDGVIRYELQGSGHHHHVICKSCKSVEPVDFCTVVGEEKILQKMGYRDISHRLEFFGLCRDCQRTTR